MKRDTTVRLGRSGAVRKVPSYLNRIRATLPSRTTGIHQIDLFCEVHFDENGAWLLAPEGVFRSFRAGEGWGQWRPHDIALDDMRGWLGRRRGGASEVTEE